MSNYNFTLNMIPNTGTPVVVNLSQGDIGRELTFKLVEGSDPNITIATDASAITIEGLKPSGLGFSESCTATSGNTITVSTTEAMTQESGMIPAEVRFTAGTKDLGTANIIFAIEESPHPAGTIDGTQDTMQNLEARLQAEIDDVDDRVTALENAEESGLTQEEKNLILTLFNKAAYAEDDAKTSYDALEALWRVVYRSIVYNLTNCHSSSSVTSVENGKGYSTALSVMGGYSITTVSVTMGGTDVTSQYYHSGSISIPRVTGDVVITAVATKSLNSITATYTQSGTVYDTDSLDTLKSDLVVTANYSDGTSGTVTDYTLSGTLTEGTSVVTVSYGGKTASFNVTVTHVEVGLLHYWDFTSGSLVDTVDGETAVTVGENTTITSGTGITIDAVQDYVAIPFAYANSCMRAKIKFGAINRTAFGNERLLCIAASVGSTPNVILRYNNSNSVWETQSGVSTGITSPTAFENGELIIERNNGSKTHFNVIFGGNTIISNYSRGSNSDAISVGSKDASSFNTIAVESIKVYSE